MIYHLSPTVQRKIWGGKNLEILKGLSAQVGSDPVGETWEISIHPDGPSFCNEKILEIHNHEELPYLAKLIDTGDELSIQVHPNDEYANKHENSSGKSECWLILKTEKNAGIYLGLKDGVTKNDLILGLDKKAKINEFLNFYPVMPGDFFYVPAGTIHAIGKGILLAEIQQSSGITYRVWDWNRLDSKGNPRELHVKKSLDVINFDTKANTPVYFKITHGLFEASGKKVLLEHPAFKLSLVNLAKGQEVELSFSQENNRLASLLNLQSELEINGEKLSNYSAVLFRDEKKIVVKAVDDKGSFLFIE